MTSSGRIGLLGGTFDPFHHGHLAVAVAADAALDLDAVYVIPAAVPPHRQRQPGASASHRFAMAALGVAETPGLRVDDRELLATGPSYTSLTLAMFAAEGWGPSQIFFITGADAFAEIATWHDYPDILDRAHFVVIARPGHDVRTLGEQLPAISHRMRVADAMSPPGPDETRQPAIWLVHVKTPAVSATAIRDAAAEGRPISGLTPPLVEQHILRHGLYGRSGRRPASAAGSDEAASELHAQEHV
jgi:nicotinate-nucleotide adenylyltransferase